MSDSGNSEYILVKEKIIHLLGIYPIISPTMLQVGLGPHCKPAIWRPALQALVDIGDVVEGTDTKLNPAGRHNTYNLLYLRATVADMALRKES